MGLSYKDLKVFNSGCLINLQVPRQSAWSAGRRIQVINHKRTFSTMSGSTAIRFSALDDTTTRQQGGRQKIITKLSICVLLSRSVVGSVKYQNVEVTIRDIQNNIKPYSFKSTVEIMAPNTIWITQV